MIKKFISAFAITFASFSASYAEPTLNDYKDFQTKWPLITVRFREDNNELRFIWANDKAMKGLEDGKGHYEDGAVFSKIGFKSEDDPLFVSSKVPNGTRRVQLMVRDKVKYANTDGWGYFLFDSSGKSVETNVNACAACHRVAVDRGYVFAQKVALENLFKEPATNLPPISISASEVVFEDTSLKAVPANFRKYIAAAKTKNVRRLLKPWLPAAFEGTADEIRPLLTKEVLKSGKASFYLSPDSRVFSYVANSKSSSCPEKQTALKATVVFVPATSVNTSEVRTREFEYCVNAI
ncbi:cytochrome P460 family protein [Bdellovibrio sp. HCB2-146]|uniref:cytochrome P460 family protein n=1 Tax=Bdellovibrio sp. HCB2-146 TaxID=3394362 RepID=UPI0039BD1E5B